MKLTASAAAHRELKIGKSLADRALKNVVPVLDYGQDADTDRYFLVMPVCEYSLQDYLSTQGPLDWSKAKPILLDIIRGLSEVGDIVHRDLKPANILWHEGTWKIADFGIAKFVEDSTSLQTLRDALTPVYAAPEQWLGEAPTRATDVYALGCIIHTMINGQPPFGGSVEAIRKGHINDLAPSLNGVPPRLSSLVVHMLRKNADARPSLARCQETISGVDAITRPSSNALAAVGERIAQEESIAEAASRAEEATRKRRSSLAAEASRELKEIRQRLFGEIARASESVKIVKNEIFLGGARMSFADAESLSLAPIAVPSSYGSEWDMISHSSITLSAEVTRYSSSDAAVYMPSVSLVFFRKSKDDEYRWRELAFWSMYDRNPNVPYALAPRDRNFAVAMSNVMGAVNVAHGPVLIDGEDEDDFQGRWIALFAKAASKQLRRPNQMPPPPSFFKGE
ncbi:MAG: serine/threonine protein kinase [Comamonadaceae bacterium]|nr:MAG: serine/threonine protein kinase [Comamonadaceae bacterium]